MILWGCIIVVVSIICFLILFGRWENKQEQALRFAQSHSEYDQRASGYLLNQMAFQDVVVKVAGLGIIVGLALIAIGVVKRYFL
jgi:hypothetical protein